MGERLVGTMAVVAVVLVALSVAFAVVAMGIAFGPAVAFSLASALCFLGALLMLCLIGEIRERRTSGDGQAQGHDA